MIDPANSDAALVRAALDTPLELDGPDHVREAHDALDRLAAAAERADELFRLLRESQAEDVLATQMRDEAEAALLAAQQERDEWEGRFRASNARVTRAEATNTRLREALEVVTGTLVQARFSDISDEEYDAAIASSSAALAPDVEQENT